MCGSMRSRLEGEPLCSAFAPRASASGSAFGISLAVSRGSFLLLSGELKMFTVPCDSGRTEHCAFCPTSGTRIPTIRPRRLPFRPPPHPVTSTHSRHVVIRARSSHSAAR